MRSSSLAVLFFLAGNLSAQPTISMSVNGSGDTDAFRGRPLVIEATALHPDSMRGGTAAPVVLAGPDGAWAGTISIRITREQGDQNWPLHAAAVPSGPLALAVDDAGGAAWWLTPEETAALPPGEYELVAVLDTSQSTAANGWKGVAASEPVTVRLRDEPDQLTGAETADKYLLSADFEFLRGDAARAGALIEELLAAQPDNIDAWSFKADLLVEAEQYRDALAAIGRAIGAYYKKHSESAGAASLFRKQGAVLAKLAGGDR